MNAKAYLDKYGKDGAEKVAIKAGTKLSYFTQIAAGIRRPSVELAKRLVKASAGELDFVELLSNKKAA